MMRQSRRTSSALGISNNQGSVTDLHSQHTHTVGGPVGTYGNNNNGGMGTYGSGGTGYGLGAGKGMGNGSMQSLQSGAQGHGYANSPTMGSMAGGQMAPRAGTPLEQAQQQQSQTRLSNPAMHAQSAPSSTIPSLTPGVQQPNVQPQAQATTGAATASAGAGATGQGQIQGGAKNQNPPFEMKASFSYTASPDDPNEISFVKGEILTILDNSGKWFNARKMDGQEGIVPR